jgi:hypothetical protein
MNPYIQQFNTQLDNFINDLQILFKGNQGMMDKINMFKFAQSVIKKINFKKPIEVVVYQILPFKDKIMADDDNYLLEYNYEKEVDLFFEQFNYTNEVRNEENIKQVMNMLKDTYKNQTKADQEIIRKYFKVLLILGEKALGLS